MTVTLSTTFASRHPAPVRRGPSALLREPCDLEVVIPAYNEEGRLPATLTEIVRELSALTGVDSRIVIVDNGSSDRTAEVVDRVVRTLGLGGPDIVVIGCSTPGKGAAVRRGMTSSQARIVGFVDADLSVPAHVLGDALRRMHEGNDVVIASRRCQGASYEVLQPRFRRLGGWAFRTAIGSLMPGVADSQCGFKFFSLAAAHAVFDDMDVTGFAFDVEVLMRASRLGFAIAEMPVAWSDDSASTLNLVSHAPGIARDIARLHRLDAALGRRARFVPWHSFVVNSADVRSVTKAFAAVRSVHGAHSTKPRSDDALRVA
jgi:dolichyl-phosphate beta-glucosyltransferase